MWVTSSTAKVIQPTAMALGNFDGIHRGHRQVLQPILNPDLGSDLRPDLGPERTIYPTVVTFDPHPREFFTGQKKQLLTPLLEKIELLEELGVEQLVLLPFDRELAVLSPREFVEEILVKQLQACLISVGEDFRFGNNRKGDATELQAIATQLGVKVIITSQQKDQQIVRISSSLIRQALEKGDISQANRLLGREYSLKGKVITGNKLGRTIGFPTANLQLPPDKFLPKLGVYSVKVFLPQEQFPRKGVMNIGSRPTVTNEKLPTVEVHLLDWSGDLYGQTITVKLAKYLRPELKFPSLEALKTQITRDCETARQE